MVSDEVENERKCKQMEALRMNYFSAMRGYYASQKMAAIVEALLAGILVTLGMFAFTQVDRTEHQFGITVLLSAGIFMLPARVRTFFSIGSRLKRITATLLRDPIAFHQSEQTHLEEWMRSVRRNYAIDAVAVLLGLVLVVCGTLMKRRKLLGRGLGLILCAITRFIGEFWEQLGTLRYRNALIIGQRSLDWHMAKLYVRSTEALTPSVRVAAEIEDDI